MDERPWRDSGAAFFATLALATMVFYAGTFYRGATAASQLTAAVLLVLLACGGTKAIVDPLALATARSRWWSRLPPLLWLSVAASWLLSPVGRAGEAIVIFLPPALWAAAGAGRLLRRPAARRWALAGCAVVTVAASIWGLIHQPLHEQGRAALPLGHHNQLALVLVALLPPSLLGVWRLARAFRRSPAAAADPLATNLGGARGLAGVAGARASLIAVAATGSIVVWTVGATGSMSGLLALATQVVAATAWALWRFGGRRWLSRIAASLGLLAVLAALTLAAGWAGARLDVPGPVERLGAVLRLEDPSLLSRRTYADAALGGFAERPVLGWGPGSSSWTLARHWKPAPGVHPPGEVVTDAHSLVAQTLYEVGAVGSLLLLAVIGRYGQRRLVELLRASKREGERRSAADPVEDHAVHTVRDPALLAAALLGLLGAASCLMFGVFAGVTAVPAVLIMNLGLIAAAGAGGPRPASDENRNELAADDEAGHREAPSRPGPSVAASAPAQLSAESAWRQKHEEPATTQSEPSGRADRPWTHEAAEGTRSESAGRQSWPWARKKPATTRSESGGRLSRLSPLAWPPRAWARIFFFVWLAGACAWSLEKAKATRSWERAIEAASGLAASPGSPEAAAQEGLRAEGTARHLQAAAAADSGFAAEETARHLRAAAAADPGFPLYRLRLDSWAAAEAAAGLAPLWLLAGVDESVDSARRREALESACDLDPLSALAPFELMRLERGEGVAASDPQVSARAARAIIAEPRLLAAVTFEGDPDLRAELHRRIQAWPGLPPGWLAAFEELWLALDWSNGLEGPPQDVLSIDADGRAAVSFSLFAFRRTPWPFSIGAAPLRSHRLATIAAHDLPAATRLPQTAPDPFWRPRCGLEDEAG